MLAATLLKLGVNFASDRLDAAGNPSTLAATDSAGVIPIKNWNNETGATATATGLTDSTGAASPVGISWQANGEWDAATQENMTDQFPAGPDNELMDGYLDAFGGTAVATTANLTMTTPGALDGNGILLTGLSASQAYDVYVYSLQAIIGRNSNISVLGAGMSTQPITTPGQVSTYIAGANGDYLMFPAVQPSASGDILIEGDGTTFRTPFQGVEIVQSATQTSGPAAPTNLTAKLDANGKSADLSFTENASDLTNNNVDSFLIQRGTAQGGPFTTIATILPDASGTATYNDATISAGQNYFYQVIAVNHFMGHSQSAPSNVAGPVKIPVVGAVNDVGINFGADRTNATAMAPFALAPTDMAGVVPISHWNNAAGGTGTTPVLNDNTGAITTLGVSWKANGTWDATQEEVTDAFPNPSGDFTLMGGYLDNSGGTAPATSAALASGTLNGNGVLLNGLPSGQTYNVYVYSLPSVAGRGGAITVTGGNSASGTETAAISMTYVAGQDYLLFPDVVASGGNLLISPDGVSFRIAIQGVELVPVTAPTSGPAAPTSLKAVLDANGTSADLTWTETATNAAGYLVQRGTSASGPFTTLTSLIPDAGGTGKYQDNSLHGGQPYWYQVVAFNTFTGGSAASNVAGPVTIPITTTPSDIGVNFGADRVDAQMNPFALAPTDSAGKVPMTNWNNENGGTGSALVLKDSTGGFTTAGVSWQSNGTWDAGTQEGLTDAFTGADFVLMSGYLDNFGGTAAATSATLTSGKLDGNGVLFTALPAGTYDVYVYSLPSVVGRGGTLTVTGASATTLGPIVADVSTTYVQGTNYEMFPAVQVASGGELLITPDGTSLRDAIQGVELVPVQSKFQDVITGTPGNDAITLKQDATDHTQIDWTLGAQSGKLPITDPAGLTINGNGGTDTITLDNSNGDPLPKLLNLNQTGANSRFIIAGLQQIPAGDKWDIANSTVQINYSGSTILPAVQSALKSGRIFSSKLASNPKFAIADDDSADPLNSGQPANTILLKPAIIGNATLSGKVGFADFVQLARNYGKTGADWAMGDFDYDAKVDFGDLVALARNYNQSGPAATGATASLAATLQADSSLADSQGKKKSAHRRH